MERINEVKILDNNGTVEISYDDGKCINKTYEKATAIKIGIKGGIYQNKIIASLNLPSRKEISETGEIEFKQCIFSGNCEWNFFNYNAKLLFHDCIFLMNLELNGYFSETVSFEKSTFFGNKASFQESCFEHFVFDGVTLNNCICDFQESTFYSNNIFFGNMSLKCSQLLFNNTFFPKNANLLDMLGTETDEKSKILFNMIDFSFTEVRMFEAKMNWLEFRDCTFECNRFDFNFKCNTLIMQDCKNFRILTLTGLEELENLNILNFVNTGRVIINDPPVSFMNAIKSQRKIYWIRGSLYEIPEYEQIRNELYALLSFFDASQHNYLKEIQTEINMLEKIEREKKRLQEPSTGMRIFLSYSWSDDELANDIDNKFAEKGITLERDRRDLKYKSSIKEFMKRIRQDDFVLIIISDNYLKSANCMYEVTEFIKDENYKERILPILRNDAKIFNAMERTQYIRYWQNEYIKLREEASDIEEANKIDNLRERIRYERIQRELPEFMCSISDMNLIICDAHITDEDFEKIQVLLFEGM